MLLNIDIPNSIDGSWYDGQVIAGLKEAVFEKSSAPRHATELHNILLTKMGKGVYSIVSYSYLFESQPRTAPHNSWRNPAERMMSILNLCFQSIGLMRSEMSEAAEAALKNSNSIALLRKAGAPFKDEICTSLDSTKSLLSDVISRLQLKGKKFKVFESCSDEDIDNFWEVLQLIEPRLTREDTKKKTLLTNLD